MLINSAMSHYRLVGCHAGHLVVHRLIIIGEDAQSIIYALRGEESCSFTDSFSFRCLPIKSLLRRWCD